MQKWHQPAPLLSDPGSTAVWFAGKSLTFEQLQESINPLVGQLNSYRQHKVIGLLSDDKWRIFLLVHLCSQAKKSLLILNPELSEQRLQSLLQQSGCDLVITDQKQLSFPLIKNVIDIENFFSMTQHQKKQTVVADPADIQLIVATSGSSGEPKAVMLSAAALAASTNTVNRSLNLQAGNCWMNCLPLFHIAGLSIVYRCARAGASMLMHQRFDAQRVWEDLHDYPVTHISLVPAMLSSLLDVSAGARPPETLRVVLIGGAALSPSLAERAHATGWPLVVSYGMTETCAMCVFDASEEAGLVANKVGWPIEGCEISVSGKQKNIQVCGPALMSGYANPEQTPGSGLLDGCFVTGDTGRLDEKGALYVYGRSDEILVSGGKTIHPREVEEILEKFTGAGRVAVTALSDPVWGDKLVAAYEADDIEKSEFEEWTRMQLPASIRPRLFVQLQQLPVNPMGKLDRVRLKELVRQQGT